MINRDDIEAGDKVYTRDGGCLVAREHDDEIWLGLHEICRWRPDGMVKCFRGHPLDIVRIEKAPKPVVEEVYVTWDDAGLWAYKNYLEVDKWKHAIKLTIINGKLDKAEQVK